MLYIFHVDTGTMMTFDMNLALESVSQLKEAIEATCGISCDKQVLLASGGESLDPTQRVCSYSTGTDTSPIFLFSKSSIESTTPPSPSVDYGSDSDMKDEVETSLSLPATITTVNLRCQLAQQLCELARTQTKVCENLVHDQHMQQQGWAAVVANLDDITAAFRARSELFEQSFNQYLESRHQFIVMLESFERDVETLSRIPVLPALLDKEAEDSGESGNGNEGEDEVVEESSSSGPATLLHWISSKDRQASLEQVAEQCRKGLDQFDSKVLEGLKAEVTACLDAASTGDLREIKGLEERLLGLETLRSEAKKIVQEQADLAQALVHNQTRASNIGDSSILPDLCVFHKRQLVVMLKNHHHIRDIRRRCIRAKQELSTNLYQRLKWVMYIESRICDMDVKLVMYHESVKRLRRHLEVLQQVHLAPNMYVSAVAEVVRRRSFSQAFLTWASDLALQLCAVYSEEVARRKQFQSQFEGHFLASLFPGLEDYPPPFATQAPQLFDANLPKLSMEDIESLRTKLPDLALSLSIPDLTAINQFFLNRSSSQLKPESGNAAASIEDRIVEAVSAAGLSSNLDPALLQPTDNSQSSAQSATTTHPISDRGFESETDTEEFENVGQSPSDLGFEKKGCARIEVNVASGPRSQMRKLNLTVEEACAALRNDMGQLKEWVLCERSSLNELFDQINKQCMEQAQAFNEQLKQKELEIEELRRVSFDLEQRLKTALKQASGEDEVRDAREALEAQLGELQEAHRAALKELTERLTHAHKTEIEAIRSRYRLYTTSQNLERSPSETSLEKVERPDYIEKAQHEAVVAQLKEEFEAHKAKLLQDSAAKWRSKLEQELAKNKLRIAAEGQNMFNEAVRQVVVEKERQLDEVRAREQNLLSECAKLKDTISRFTSSSGNVEVTTNLMKKVKKLEGERDRLTAELQELKGVTLPRPISSASSNTSSSAVFTDLNTTSSITVVSEPKSLDVGTSPDSSPTRVKTPTTSLVQEGKICIATCNVGDPVLIIWDENLQTYIVYQTSHRRFFLHTDCLEKLGLNASPRVMYTIGEVEHREFCQAKKTENRYHVPKGSRFFRVKVKPVTAAVLGRALGPPSLPSDSPTSL